MRIVLRRTASLAAVLLALTTACSPTASAIYIATQPARSSDENAFVIHTDQHDIGIESVLSRKLNIVSRSHIRAVSSAADEDDDEDSRKTQFILMVPTDVVYANLEYSALDSIAIELGIAEIPPEDVLVVREMGQENIGATGKSVSPDGERLTSIRTGSSPGMGTSRSTDSESPAVPGTLTSTESTDLRTPSANGTGSSGDPQAVDDGVADDPASGNADSGSEQSDQPDDKPAEETQAISSGDSGTGPDNSNAGGNGNGNANGSSSSEDSTADDEPADNPGNSGTGPDNSNGNGTINGNAQNGGESDASASGDEESIDDEPVVEIENQSAFKSPVDDQEPEVPAEVDPTATGEDPSVEPLADNSKGQNETKNSKKR